MSAGSAHRGGRGGSDARLARPGRVASSGWVDRSADRRAGATARYGDDDPESGQIMVLGIGFVVVLVALVLVITAVSAVHIDRKRALGVADAAAAAAADAVAEEAFYAEGRETLLTDELVVQAATEYLSQVDVSTRGGIRSLALAEPTGTPDGATAIVTLVAVIEPPVVPAIVSEAAGPIEVTVTGRARAFDRTPDP